MAPKISAFTFGDDDEHTPGSHVQVSCTVNEGDLPVDISWTFHGVRESPASMTGITTTKLGPRSSVLQIEAVTAAHSGAYCCTAKNAAGTQNYTAQLRVLGKIERRNQSCQAAFPHRFHLRLFPSLPIRFFKSRRGITVLRRHLSHSFAPPIISGSS